MSHLSDNQLMQDLQGDAQSLESPAANAHLQTCPACQERLAALHSVWNALGTWNPPQVPKDMEARILQSLPDHAERQVPQRHWRRYLQVAAALALAVGLGHLAGRLTWRPPAPEPASETAAAESLHLDDANSADILLAAVDSPEGDQP